MINRSQRSQPPGPAPGLDLHAELARRRQLRQRLLHGSAAALAVSLLLWLLAVPMTWHLLGALAALAAGALFPSRGAGRWALEFIARQAGLSYQTALEQRGKPDPYGLGAAVAARAGEQLKRLEKPKAQAWWLPLLIFAALLALLPVTPFGASPRPLPFSQPPAAAPSAEAALPEPDAAPPQDAALPSAPPEAEADAPDAAPTSTPTTLDGLEGREGSASDTLSEQVADEEALAQFLETLQNRPPPEPETNPFSSVQPQRERRPGESEGEERDEAEGDSGEPGESGGEQAPPDTPRDTGGEGDGEDRPEADPGSEPGSAAAEPAPDETPSEDAAEAGGEPQDQEDGTAPVGASPQDPAAADEGEPQGDAGLDAGALPTPGTDPEGQEATGPQGDPEFLRGLQQDGPSSLAGTTRLPGDPEAAQRLPGSAPGSFERAREEAIQEGRIPLEYQDIIRNYFR